MGYTNKEALKWIFDKAETSTKRYIEAETFIMDIVDMPWYKKLFLNKKILFFLSTRKKYES